MAIKESELQEITVLSVQDYVRAVTSLGGSRNVAVSDLAKTVATNFPIHEVAELSGNLTGSEFFILDTGTENYKIAADKVSNSLIQTGAYVAGFKAENPNNDNRVALMIGEGQVNRGVYVWGPNSLSKWLVHAGESGTAYLDGYPVTPVTLTKTYTENNYVNETDFNRIIAIQYGRLVVINGNLQIENNVPQSSDFLTIGKINLPKSALTDASQIVPCQYGVSIYIGVHTNGDVRLYNYNTADAGGWARFNCTLVLS